MPKTIVLIVSWIVCAASVELACAQPQQFYEAAPCESCNYGQSSYIAEPGYSNGGHWIDDGSYAGPNGCECSDCVATGRMPRLRNVGSRVRGRVGGRHGGEGILRGRPENMIGAPYVTGECGDCNWGPAYLSLFAGGAFIDNLDSRFTFDNGMAGMLGVQETGFSTLDGVATGGAIGRYFYRQARAEFEYTFRDNGIGDVGVSTYSDDLSTPQINDTLVSSVITPADGNMQSNSFMFNIVIDLKPRTVGCLNGYLGGGIGAIYLDADIAAGATTFDIDDSSFAFQGIAGINFPIRERIDLFTEYRYLGADSVKVDRTNMAGTVSLGAFRFDSHNVVFGMRFLR